jgi:hypothetical protein
MMRQFFSVVLTIVLLQLPVCREAVLAAQTSAKVSVPQSSQLKLILKTYLSTRTSRPGDAFSAELADAVVVNNKVVLPGTLGGSASQPAVLISGTIASAEPGKRFSQFRGKATMLLRFEKIRYGAWQEDLAATLVSLHDPLNPKQRVSTSDEGQVRAKEDLKGDLTKGAIGAGGGTLLGLIFGNVSRGLMIGVIAGGAAVLATKGKNVEMQPGTGIVIQLARPLEVVPYEPAAAKGNEDIKQPVPSKPVKPETISPEPEPPEVVSPKEPVVEKLEQ